jgi:hypothetical protein
VDGLTRPLPTLPAGELFGRRIVNHFPRSPKLTAAWLEMVAEAARWGSEPFAIWIAREVVRDAKKLSSGQLRLLGLWAWFSQQPPTDGYHLMKTLWHSEMQFDAAVSAARAWRRRLILELMLGRGPIDDLWLRPGPFDGYDFVPLDTVGGLIEEAAAMENCVDAYGCDIAADHCRLWSIRREEQPIANLEIRRHSAGPLFIGQLNGARNEAAPVEIWWLAMRWLHQHGLMSIRAEAPSGHRGEPDIAVWRRLWRPYWLAKRQLPVWLPLMPTWRVIHALG